MEPFADLAEFGWCHAATLRGNIRSYLMMFPVTETFKQI